MLSINAALSSVVALMRGRHTNNDRGATAVEYGLMVALIAAVIAGVVLLLGTHLNSKFQGVDNCVQSSANCTPTSTP